MNAWDSMKGWRGALGQLVLVPGMLRQLQDDQESRLNAMVELFRAKREADPVATLLVIGQTANSYRHEYVRPKEEGPPELVPEKTFTACFAASKRISGGRNSTQLEIDAMRPLEACTVVVLADLERVEVQGLFVGANVITLGSPVGFFERVMPGEKIRAMVYQREPSGK